MIVWVNGASRAGKSTAARELIDLIPNCTFFDPEVIDAELERLLPPKRLAEVSDRQDLPIWRRLVVDTAAALHAELGGVIVVPMGLLRQEYRDEIFGGFAARRIPVCHVLLVPGETILRRRHPAGEAPADIGAYRAAFTGWLAADAYPVDNGTLTPRETAVRIAAAVRSGAAAPCDIVQTPEPTAETVAAGVLLFDAEDRVLLVDPTYKPGWEFPGGVVEPGEAPARAGIREVAEETGIELTDVPGLLVVDWEPPMAPAYGGLRLLFDGGRLPGPGAPRVVLPGPELRAWRFVTEDEAADLLPPVRYERLRWALRARERGAAHYLEAGIPTGSA